MMLLLAKCAVCGEEGYAWAAITGFCAECYESSERRKRFLRVLPGGKSVGVKG